MVISVNFFRIQLRDLPVHLKVPLSHKNIGCSVADPVSDVVISVNFFRIQIRDLPVHLKIPLSYKNIGCSVADWVPKCSYQ